MRNKRWLALIALLAAMLVVGLEVEFNPPPGQPSSSSTNFSTSQQSSTSSLGVTVPSLSASALDSQTNLRLGLNLSVASNAMVNVTIYEFNTLDRVNNVSAEYRYPTNTSLFQWVQTDCQGGIAGFEILQGNYGLSNYSTGTALWLQPRAWIPSCPLSIDDHYSFKRLAYAGVVSGAWATFWTGSGPWGSTVAVAGSCPGTNSSSGCALKSEPFPPGTYTVLAGDEWGQVVILHFTIGSDWRYLRG